MIDSLAVDSLRLLERHTHKPGTGYHEPDEKIIEPAILAKARGVAFVFAEKAGIIVSGSVGAGLVIARKEGSQEWGLPIAFGVGGGGIGLQVGVMHDFQVVVLNTDEAVKTFVTHNCKYAVELNMASAGGVHHKGTASAGNVGDTIYPEKPAIVYGAPEGHFAGISLGSLVIIAMDSWNEKYYGTKGASSVEYLYGTALAGKTPSEQVAALQAALTERSTIHAA